MTPEEFEEAKAGLIERGIVRIDGGYVIPGRNIWSDVEIQLMLPRCLQVVRRRRKGIRAADTDLLLTIQRRYERSGVPTLSQKHKLSYLMPKLLWIGAEEMGDYE